MKNLLKTIEAIFFLENVRLSPAKLSWIPSASTHFSPLNVHTLIIFSKIFRYRWTTILLAQFWDNLRIWYYSAFYHPPISTTTVNLSSATYRCSLFTVAKSYNPKTLHLIFQNLDRRNGYRFMEIVGTWNREKPSFSWNRKAFLIQFAIAPAWRFTLIHHDWE